MSAKNYSVAALIFLFFLFPLLSIPPYFDDYARYSFQKIGLLDQGRFLTEFIYMALGITNNPLPVDNHATWIFVSGLLFFGVVLLVTKYVKQSVSTTILCSLIFTSPMLLENLSYTIDTIGMALSITLSIVSAFMLRSDKQHSLVLSFFLLMTGSFFYQASFYVYASSVILITLVDINRRDTKDHVSFIFKSFISLLLTAIIVMKITDIVATDAYVAQHSAFIKIDNDYLPSITNNIRQVNFIIKESLSSLQLACVYLLAFLSFFTSLFNSHKLLKKKKYFLSVLAIASLPVSIMLVYLPHVLFKTPVIEPRVFMSFGITLASMALIISTAKFLKKIAVIVSVIFILSSISISSAYSSSANYYTMRSVSLMNLVQCELAHSNVAYDAKIAFVGYPNIQGPYRSNSSTYPLISRLMKDPFRNKWVARHWLNYYGYDYRFIMNNEFNEENVIIKNPKFLISKEKNETYVIKFR